MSNCVKQTLENFKYFVLQNNTNTGLGTTGLLLSAGIETKIATLTVPVDCDDFVWLSGTIGWINNSAGNATLTVRIHRDNEVTGPVIFSTLDSTSATFNVTTSFSHVDSNLPRTSDCVTYILTVTANVAGVSITGPVTFIAATIDNKHHEEKPHCEPCCEPQCKPHCEPQCKPYYKPYGQKFDFD